MLANERSDASGDGDLFTRRRRIRVRHRRRGHSAFHDLSEVEIRSHVPTAAHLEICPRDAPGFDRVHPLLSAACGPIAASSV